MGLALDDLSADRKKMLMFAQSSLRFSDPKTQERTILDILKVHIE
jgi:hypothetical protein